MKKYDPTITVCSKCKRTCCWHGEFMCDEAYGASTVERKISTLIKGDYGEHPDYWNDALYEANQRLLTREDLIALGVKDEHYLELSHKDEKFISP